MGRLVILLLIDVGWLVRLLVGLATASFVFFLVHSFGGGVEVSLVLGGFLVLLFYVFVFLGG